MDPAIVDNSNFNFGNGPVDWTKPSSPTALEGAEPLPLAPNAQGDWELNTDDLVLRYKDMKPLDEQMEYLSAPTSVASASTPSNQAPPQSPASNNTTPSPTVPPAAPAEEPWWKQAGDWYEKNVADPVADFAHSESEAIQGGVKNIGDAAKNINWDTVSDASIALGAAGMVDPLTTLPATGLVAGGVAIKGLGYLADAGEDIAKVRSATQEAGSAVKDVSTVANDAAAERTAAQAASSATDDASAGAKADFSPPPKAQEPLKVTEPEKPFGQITKSEFDDKFKVESEGDVSDLNASEKANYDRYVAQRAKGTEISIVNLDNGNKAFIAKVPGRDPGRMAEYFKEVNNEGKTISMYKTSYLPDGSLEHIKQKPVE